jgi:hypothetical protein
MFALSAFRAFESWVLEVRVNKMLAKTLGCFLITFVALVPRAAWAKPGDFPDIDALSHWISYYYTDPQPHRVVDALRAASAHGLTREGQNVEPFFGFLAGIFSKNHSMVEAMAEELVSLPEVDQSILVMGIWYSSYPEAKRLLGQLRDSMPKQAASIDYLLKGGQMGVTDLPPEQGPWVLDALWGNFMATGDHAPVIRVMSVLPWVNVRGDTQQLLVGGAARWSLISNAIQHKAVMAMCREQVAKQPKDVADELLRVIAEAEDEMKGGKMK